MLAILWDYCVGSEIFPLNKEDLVCGVITTPANKAKAVAVKETWGRLCGELVFVNSVRDPDLPGYTIPSNSFDLRVCVFVCVGLWCGVWLGYSLGYLLGCVSFVCWMC